MMATTDNLATKYLKWLTDNIKEQPLENGWREIATPFLDQFYDGITVYARENGDCITLSDDGVTANNTICLGGPLQQKKMAAFRMFLKQYGIEVTDNGEMLMNTSHDKYPIHFHLFLQAIVSANEIFSPGLLQKVKCEM